MLEIDKYHLCCFTIKFTCKSALRNPGRLLSVSDDTLKKKKKKPRFQMSSLHFELINLSLNQDIRILLQFCIFPL